MPGFGQFIRDNLVHVMPVIGVGVFGLAIILERLRALYLAYPMRNQNRFFDQIRELVMANEIAEAIAVCDRQPKKPVAQVVKKGLLRAHQPENLIENGLELAVEEESQKVQRRTSFLSMVANVATLLGLLGTIGGLIQSFAAVANVDAAQKTQLLAAGISTAMNATMLGLGVAIPAMIAFSFLMNKSNRITADVETAAVRVLDILKQRYFVAESSVGVVKPGQTGSFPAPGGTNTNISGRRIA